LTIAGGQGDYFLRPTYGYLTCGPTQCSSISQEMSGDFGQTRFDDPRIPTRYTCQEFMGINDGCSITLLTTDGDIDNFLHTRQQLDYQIVAEGAPFSENLFKTVADGGFGYDNGERSDPITLGPNDVLYVRFVEGTGAFDFSYKKVDGKVDFLVSGTCFTLQDINDLSSTSGQRLTGAIEGDCLLRDDYYKSRKITFFSNVFNELSAQELDWRNLNRPYEKYTYLKGLEPAPWIENTVQQHNGEPVYCDKGSLNLYEIGQISTLGRTYDSVNIDPSGIVGKVDNCCEGDIQPNKICQNDEWISSTEATCDLDRGIFCPESGFTPYSSNQCRRFSCVDNTCQPEFKSVACNFPGDCGVNQVCQKTTECGGVCVDRGRGEICGDNICSSAEFKSGSCQTDCQVSPIQGQSLIPWIVGGFFGIIIVILIVVIIRKRQGGGF
jgi:hypothetical protein